MEHLSVKNNLGKYSWGQLQRAYIALGLTLQSYQVVESRIKIPQPHISFTDPENIFLIRWGQDIRRIDSMISLLDDEIARRNNLIGVMG